MPVRSLPAKLDHEFWDTLLNPFAGKMDNCHITKLYGIFMTINYIYNMYKQTDNDISQPIKEIHRKLMTTYMTLGLLAHQVSPCLLTLQQIFQIIQIIGRVFEQLRFKITTLFLFIINSNFKIF